ncbi:hypothetical protein [Actinoallomurus iriomotensis]|uniref:hypothetical protein n=1 Tax=Actinoallomurus iriomotensis TaxID=478107 RepID=UPI002554CE14|nr:hypothetical protein [Actinoallomurus iriomotensis]
MERTAREGTGTRRGNALVRTGLSGGRSGLHGSGLGDAGLGGDARLRGSGLGGTGLSGDARLRGSGLGGAGLSGGGSRLRGSGDLSLDLRDTRLHGSGIGDSGLSGGGSRPRGSGIGDLSLSGGDARLRGSGLGGAGLSGGGSRLRGSGDLSLDLRDTRLHGSGVRDAGLDSRDACLCGSGIRDTRLSGGGARLRSSGFGDAGLGNGGVVGGRRRDMGAGRGIRGVFGGVVAGVGVVARPVDANGTGDRRAALGARFFGHGGRVIGRGRPGLPRSVSRVGGGGRRVAASDPFGVGRRPDPGRRTLASLTGARPLRGHGRATADIGILHAGLFSRRLRGHALGHRPPGDRRARSRRAFTRSGLCRRRRSAYAVLARPGHRRPVGTIGGRPGLARRHVGH